jgi:hypothetical protein
MTIHSEFWLSRRTALAPLSHLGGYLGTLRDSNRQRCYNWENKHLRPGSKSMDQQEAKGYARLCVKAAIRHMRGSGLIKSDEDAEKVRSSFRAAFTKETLSHCNANAAGAYFAKWGWTDVIIAHEVAHWADQWAHRLSANPGVRVPYEPHGPKWRGWFVFILASAGMRNRPEVGTTELAASLSVERLAVHIPT